MTIYHFLFLLLSNFLLGTLMGQSCPVVDAGPDHVICEPGQVVRLQGSIQGPYDRFFWEPTTGLTPPNSLMPNARVFTTTTYTLVAESFDPTNLVQNGDFEQGPAGYSTDYQFVADDPARQDELVPEGTYGVGANPNNYHTGFSPCSPQSGGNMMIVNGSGMLQNIWCQTVAVEPDTEYEIKYWVASVNPASPAQIQIEMNGQTVGPVFSAGPVCAWMNLTVRWNSGGNTTVDFCLINRNTALGGNDFAIDNICMNKICREEDEVVIEVVDIQAEANGPYTITCDDPVIQLNGFGSSAGPGYSYEWRTPNGNILSGRFTLTPTVDRPGTYILTVYGPGGCEKEAAVEVTGSTEEPEVHAAVRDSVGCGTDSVRLDLLVLPGTQFYFYDWNGPNGYYSGEERPWVHEPGLYTVVVTDAFGCSSLDTVRVHAGGDLPAGEALARDSLSCAVDSVRLGVSPLMPGQQYQWTGPGGFFSEEPEPWVRDSGWYRLQVGSDPGCMLTDSVYVPANDQAPSPDLTAEEINCETDSARLRANWPAGRNADDWEWISPSGRTVSDSLMKSDEGGWHYFRMRFANGCESFDSVRVQLDTLALNIRLVADSIGCETPEARIIAIPGDSLRFFSWSGPGGFTSANRTDTVNRPGWYLASGIATNGCRFADSIEVIANDELPEISLRADTLDCRADSLTLSWSSPDTGLRFNWSGPGGFADTSATPRVGAPGTYHLQLRGPNDCLITDSVVIAEDRDKPEIRLATDSIDCQVDSALLRVIMPEASVRYTWKNAGGDTFAGGDRVVVYAGGDYSLHAEGANGCVTDTSFQVYEDADRPSVSLDGAVIDCNTPEAWLQANTPNSGLTFNWSGPGILEMRGDSIRVNAGGSYTVELTAGNGCRAQAVAEVSVDTARLPLTLTGDTIDCRNPEAVIDGTTPGANRYEWSGPGGFTATSPRITTDRGGDYSLTITADNGCSTTAQQNIPEDLLTPQIGTIFLDTIDCRMPGVRPQLNPTMLRGESYRWQGPGGFTSDQMSPELSEGGNYQLVITNDNGCADTLSALLAIDTLPPSVDVSGDTLTCSRSSTNLLVITPNEIRASSWVGPGGQTKNGASWVTSTPGWYTATITGANGCQASDSFELVVDTIAPRLDIEGDSVLHCMKSEASVFVKNNAAGATVRWTDAQGSPIGSGDSLRIDRPGNVYAEMQDPSNGCTSRTLWQISEVELPRVTGTDIADPACDETRGRFRVVDAEGGLGQLSFTIDGTPVQIGAFTALSPGEYILRVIDEIGCFTESTVEINERPELQLSLPPGFDILRGESVQLIPTINVDSNLLEVIRWSPPTGLSCSQCLQPWARPDATTTYTLYLEDAGGCSVTAQVLLRVEAPKIFIPNAFTPHNKDGANDYFIPSLGPGLELQEMSIFDRWGNRLWHSDQLDHNDPAAGWDGRANGRQMLPGVYVYRVVIGLPGGERELRIGDLTLID